MRCPFLGSFFCGLLLLVCETVLGSGGAVRPATWGGFDYVYALQNPNGTNDRAITRYGYEGVSFPHGSEFDPNTVICGARTLAGHQSNTSASRPMIVSIRYEDPNNPGFPDVVPNTTPGASSIPSGSDQNAAPAQCSSSVSYLCYTFNAGVGVPDPLIAVFLVFLLTLRETESGVFSRSV